jgi:signal transduction histidine kinase
VTDLPRIVRIGVAAAVVVGLSGWGLERVRFGSSDQDALGRVETELRQRIESGAAALGAIADRVSANADAIRQTPRDQAAVRRLFDIVAAALADADAGTTGITIYDTDATPIAWDGRVSDLTKERLNGVATLFVAPGARGLSLMRLAAIAAPTGTPRIATVVVEQALGELQSAPGLDDTFVLPTSLVPVRVRARLGVEDVTERAFTFVVPAPGGRVLLEAEVPRDELAAARSAWRNGTWAAVVGVLALTLLFCAGPLIDLRRRTRATSEFLMATAALILLVIAARAILYFALRPLSPAGPTPFDLLLTTLTMAAVVRLVMDLVERRRFARPRQVVLTRTPSATFAVAAAYVAAGVASAALLWGYEGMLRRVVGDTELDLLHFSLHPLGAARLAVEFALVLLHASMIWGAAVLIRTPAMLWRTPRTTFWRALSSIAWFAGALAVTLAARTSRVPVPIWPLWAAIAVSGLAALALARIRSRIRAASQTARLGVFFLTLLVPALAMYPSMLAYATESKEHLVAAEFGPQALALRTDLQRRLQRTVDQIDAIPALPLFVFGADARTPGTDRAFAVWSRTDLAAYRLTSAIELYDESGRLVSRFALVPEYATGSYRAPSCAWEQPYDEVSPFGSSERHVLRTGRGICDRGRMVGSLVVRVMLDYRTLPFISSQSPYLESLRPDQHVPSEGVSGRDVEFVVYGWSRAPLFESETSVWTLPDPVFQHLVDSREPFWTSIARESDTFRVYLLSDRYGIYALGYPVITWLGHLINLAEIALLVMALYVLLLAGATLFNAIAVHAPADGGRGLLREVRSSFYRKLFLAFLAGAVVPVFILAIFTRTYVARQLVAGAEDAAARTVTTAQRLVEDYATLQQRGTGAMTAIDDPILVLVRRAIDEDVNLFDRSRLQATSARDLFYSRLISTRTPADVYRAIVLERLPTFVGEEEMSGVPYRVAAAPVRASGRDGVVTVPLRNRQQEIEEQIDELNRRVLSGFVLFSLLGAALGYWMAERIADPVNRLTRATRRIARGDLDARVAATSSDELRRLVQDFNQMAADLKRQRTELERTQRLEAWADMARQVAHDIKNPLTPIQLSAEHARRVNIDRGRPLSPVLDNCVNAILTQVKLLRQISAEFSSFASSPTPRPEPTAVPALIEEVVEPYRTGLADRITITVGAAANLPDVTLDRTLFSRALTNIIENALHAMPGPGRLTIQAREHGANGRRALVVETTDSGVGMDQDALNRIFEPYFSTKATGTGLGLTIAKRNVELNGGTIDVKSQRGVGTTVTIALPIAT